MSAIAPPPSKSATAPPQQQLTALLEATGVAPLTNTGWIKVTGEDRVRWLNGMTTNSIEALASGESNYNFFLNAQGRIQADANALALDNSILLETSSAGRLATLLNNYIIMDDVELEVLSLGQVEASLPHHIAETPSKRAGILVAGPEAAAKLAAIGIPSNDLAPLHFTAINDWRGRKVAIIHAYSPLLPRFELWSEDPETIAQLADVLTTSGTTLVGDETLIQLRILEGTPLYGTDIRDKELPQETAQTRALHFAKGCYLGQEIVERIRSRGNVHRTFHSFRLEGELPAAGAILEADGKAVGELTSCTEVPLKSGTVRLALGYIRREVLERGTSISYPGGIATAIQSPFQALLKE